MLLGVDVGGTFTDAVVLGPGTLATAKTPTTPADPLPGVLAAIETALLRAELSPVDVSRFAHGMTVGTNALLTEAGARTALITTAGFGDLLEIGRQARPSLYRIREPLPRSPVAPNLRFEVDERVGPDGVVRGLEPAEIERVCGEILDATPAVESIAICLLFSYLHPAHEQALAAALGGCAPQIHVSCSHQVLPVFREYERCSTTVIDAYLTPLLSDYLNELCREAAAIGLPEPMIMQSSGGLVSAKEAVGSGAWSVLSGPAGGAVGASLAARRAGHERAIGFDMGGTSCDLCTLDADGVSRCSGRKIAGRVIALPMAEIHTVGAGGGSIAHAEAGGILAIGPRSAGAMPGPACYRRGGREPTVSDANLLCGYLPPERDISGVRLDPDAAETAIAGLAAELGLTTIGCAEGIVEIANQRILAALRVVSIERGLDPRDHALLSFGGAGGLHACALADRLGIELVLCPSAGGVLSALGMCAAEQRAEIAATVMLRGQAITRKAIDAAIGVLRDRLRKRLPQVVAAAAQERIGYELRYTGQSFELAVEDDAELEPGRLLERFAAEHERRYGYCDPTGTVELVNLRLSLIGEPPATPTPPARPARSRAIQPTRRPARFDGAWVETAIHRDLPPRDALIAGPAIFEMPDATIVVPPGRTARADLDGTLHLERAA